MGVFLRTVALGFGLVGATVTSQAPEFAQQYLQRLGGAVDELTRFVADLDRDARMSGLGREEAVARLKAQADELARRRGEDAERRVARHATLDESYRALKDAPPLGRALHVLTAADGEIARGVARDFQPALPLTAEGAFAGLGGFLAGVAGVLLTAFGVRRAKPRRQPGTVFEPVKGKGG
jgi:hypothetical protein